MQAAQITNLESGAVLADRAGLARTLLRRAVGLLSRASLPEGEGLVFPRCNSIHTWFMRFPIDVIFVRQGRILRVVPEVPPGRVLLAWGADTTIELPAGTIARTSTTQGQALQITSSEQRV